MEREKMVFNSRPAAQAEAAQPDFKGREYLLERFLKPEPRRDIVERLRAAGVRPTAMMTSPFFKPALSAEPPF